jgi:hypothetical protein
MMEVYAFLTVLVLLTIFNFSYVANCGVLVPKFFWDKASIINDKNAFTHPHYLLNSKRSEKDPLNIADFRFEPFYTENDAQKIADRVMAQKHLWERRNIAMSTLGTSSYVDGANSRTYQQKSAESNPRMMELFGDVEDRILKYFQFRAPGATIKFRDYAALPGFHIFECNKLFSSPVASVHRDLQFQRLEYAKNEKIDLKNTLSFTIALQLPKSGSGLYMIDLPPIPDVMQLLIPRPLITAFAEKTKIEYKVGYIVCHNGQHTHMIAPSAWDGEDSYRITIQGHGVYDWEKKTWYMYW